MKCKNRKNGKMKNFGFEMNYPDFLCLLLI